MDKALEALKRKTEEDEADSSSHSSRPLRKRLATKKLLDILAAPLELEKDTAKISAKTTARTASKTTAKTTAKKTKGVKKKLTKAQQKQANKEAKEAQAAKRAETLRIAKEEEQQRQADHLARIAKYEEHLEQYESLFENLFVEQGFPEPPVLRGRNKSARREHDESMARFNTQIKHAMGVGTYVHKPFKGREWAKWYGRGFLSKTSKNINKHQATARVYYLPDYVSKEEVPRLVAAVPMACSAGDGYIQLQGEPLAEQTQNHPFEELYRSPEYSTRSKYETEHTHYLPSLKDMVYQNKDIQSGKHRNLSSAIKANPFLLNIFERRRARMKCIASHVDLFAEGGYPKANLPLRYTPIQQDVIVVTGIAPEFNSRYMDYADFIFEKKDLQNGRIAAYDHLGALPSWTDVKQRIKKEWIELGTYDNHEPDNVVEYRTWKMIDKDRFFHVEGYLRTMKDSYFLWFRAFDHQVSLHPDYNTGCLNIPAMGCGLFSNIPDSERSWKYDLAKIQSRAIEDVLAEEYFPHITSVIFCDFLDGAFSTDPRDTIINDISVLYAPRRDLCHFESHEIGLSALGILNPGSGFALPGNLPGYGSVESEIGENTTLRDVQSWLVNPRLLDPRYHIAVDGFSMLVRGHETTVSIPCIISDDQSLLDLSQDGQLALNIYCDEQRNHKRRTLPRAVCDVGDEEPVDERQ